MKSSEVIVAIKISEVTTVRQQWSRLPLLPQCSNTDSGSCGLPSSYEKIDRHGQAQEISSLTLERENAFL
jgi:hypothetical protein